MKITIKLKERQKINTWHKIERMKNGQETVKVVYTIIILYIQMLIEKVTSV